MRKHAEEYEALWDHQDIREKQEMMTGMALSLTTLMVYKSQDAGQPTWNASLLLHR